MDSLRKANKNTKIRWLFLLLTVIYAITLCHFYFKYIPLIKHFQMILIPILFAAFILTVLNVQWGTLFFVFSFPLINNLPYFFSIYEDIPHAPTALVLFLFYFLGWLVYYTRFNPAFSLRQTIFKPIILFSLFILMSGIITFFRYVNFYPFLSDNMYELITNVNGVTAGGAIMSTVFNSLNYLNGFAFFFILLNTVKSKEFVKKILIVLLISTSISISFGFFQHFKDNSIGNTQIRVIHNTLNATFKDPLSFGVYLAVMIPLLLGMVFAFKKFVKVIPVIVVIGALLILPYTGSLSGLLGVSVSLLFFLIILVKVAINLKKTNTKAFRKIITSIGIISLIACVFVSVFIISDGSISFRKLKGRITYIEKKGDWDSLTSRRLSYFWEIAGYMIRDYPLSGVGIGAYIIELPNYAEFHNKKGRTADSAENYFFQVGSELGLIGLFFSLWIFWEIFKQIKKNLGKSLLQDRWKYIQIGISCGIISLFMIFFVHTYIGSYEIKYTFWLLVALIFCMGRSEKEREEKILFSKSFIILGAILVVLFSGVHLWNSTHSLSLKSRTEQFSLKQEFGFDKIEKTNEGREFRWTRGYGGMTIKIEKPVIEVPLLASHPDIQKNPVKVKIFLIKDFFKQKKLLDEIILTKSIWKIYEYYIPEEVNKEVILLFIVSRTWNPLKTLGTPDPRNLGVAVGKIGFKLKE